MFNWVIGTYSTARGAVKAAYVGYHVGGNNMVAKLPQDLSYNVAVRC